MHIPHMYSREESMVMQREERAIKDLHLNKQAQAQAF